MRVNKFYLIVVSTVQLVDKILSVAVYWCERCIKLLRGFQVRPGLIETHACIETHFRQTRVGHKCM